MHPWCFLFGLPEDDGQFIRCLSVMSHHLGGGAVVRNRLCQPALFIGRRAVGELNGHSAKHYQSERRPRWKPPEEIAEQRVGTEAPPPSAALDDASIAFDFRGARLRTVKKLGQIWFVAVDICSALDIANSRDALVGLRESEKGVGITDTPGGPQEVNVVNESGVYALAFRSRKKEAEDFRYWVTNEVIPSIRKTGRYEAGPAGVGGSHDWTRVPGRYMTLVTTETDAVTYELPFGGMIGEVTGTDVLILAHQIKLIELTWLRVRQFEAAGLSAEDCNWKRLDEVVSAAGELAARYMNYPTT